MTVVTTVAELREQLSGKTHLTGFVPTMGALHAGHAHLLQRARSDNGVVVASIFVNPLQFDRADDLQRYPRTLDTDFEICRTNGVDVAFAPSANEMYPQEQLTFVEAPSLSNQLCGTFRPGHFRGVCTVVLKLFNMVQPARAYFGQKDAQQLAVIRRMTADLNLPIEILGVATVREHDGLALSSRNRHLSPEERAIAPRLYQALQKITDALRNGERFVHKLREISEEPLKGIRVEYFEFVDPETLQPLNVVERHVLVAAAIWLGSTRLIDNVQWPDK